MDARRRNSLSNLKPYESKADFLNGKLAFLSPLFPNARTYNDLWEKYLLPLFLPLLLGLVGGLVWGLLIAKGFWYVALVGVFAIPFVILLNKYPFSVILLWFALMPFLPLGQVPSAVLWGVHRALIPLGLILSILMWLLKIKEYHPVKINIADWVMVFFLFVAVVQITIMRRTPLYYIYQLYDRVFVGFTAYWLVKLLNPNEKDLKRLIMVMFFVLWAEIIFGFWAKYAPQTLPPLFQFRRMGNRMSGTFSNPTAYAYVLMTGMMVLFHYAMVSKSRVLKYILILSFGVGLSCIFLTFTRGVWGSALLGIVGLVFLYPKPMLSLIAVSLPIFIFLAGGAMADEVTFAMQRLNTEDTIDSRIVLTEAGLQMFYAKPIFGWGYDSYDLYDWKFMTKVGNAAPTKWDIRKGTSHNTYITILAETGVVGFTLYFFPVLYLLWLSLKRRKILPKRGLCNWQLLVILWLSALFFIISGQVNDLRFFWYQLGIWWLILGVVACITQSASQGSENARF